MIQKYLQEIETNEESPEMYRKFMDLYIELYYEPLVQEYEEIRYFTEDSDRKMLKLIGDGCSSIVLKTANPL